MTVSVDKLNQAGDFYPSKGVVSAFESRCLASVKQCFKVDSSSSRA